MRCNSILTNYIRKINSFTIKINCNSILHQHKILHQHVHKNIFCNQSDTIKEISLDELLESALIDEQPSKKSNISETQSKKTLKPIIIKNIEEDENDEYILDEDSDDDENEINEIIDEVTSIDNINENIETNSSLTDVFDINNEKSDNYLTNIERIEMKHTTFKSMGLRKRLENNLCFVCGLSPLPIQSLSFNKIISFKSQYAISGSIIESGMGTGKTLAYLLPILNDLKPHLCGQIIIIIPTNELGIQIKSMIKSYLYTTDNFKHNHATSSYFSNNQNKKEKSNKQFNLQHCVMNCNSNESLDYNIDYINKIKPSIIIGTPKRIRELLLYSIIKPSKINYIVFDEIDSLFPINIKNAYKKKHLSRKYLKHSHLKPAQLILNGVIKQQSNIDNENHKCHLLFVGATISSQLKYTINNMLRPYPIQLISTYDNNCNKNITKRLISPNIHHQYISVDNSNDKPFIISELINTIRSNPKNNKLYNPGVLIFLNKDSSPINFAQELSQYDIKCALLHEYINDKTMRSKFLKLFRNGSIDAVIATETVCRGLDFIWLDHIICAEMPNIDISYLHISGRCSRLESKGFITSIVDEWEEYKLKKYCFKYQIELIQLDDKLKIDKLSKQKRKYNKINTFPLLLQNKEYQKKLKQQIYLPIHNKHQNDKIIT